MKILRDADLQLLTAAHGRPCISLYFPFHKNEESEVTAERRFSELIHNTQHALNHHEDGLMDERLLERVSKMKPTDFLDHGDLKQGVLCIFISPAIAGYVIIDDRLCNSQPKAYVGDHFHLTPILPLIQHDDSFLAVVIGDRHICVYLGNSAEFALKDRIPFPVQSDIQAHDQDAIYSYALLLKRGLKAEVANHIMNEQDRNPDLWKTLSIENFMKTSHQVIRALKPFVENSDRLVVLSGNSQWVGILRAVLANTDFILARTHHKTIGQLPAMATDILAHRARELVRSTLRQNSLMIWNKVRHQPALKLVTVPSEIIKSVDEGRSEVIFTAPDCHSVDGAVEAVLSRRGRVYVIDPHDVKFAASSQSLGIPASLSNDARYEARRDSRHSTLERSRL